MILVTSEVVVYGDEMKDRKPVIVKSHWNYNERVVLVVDGKEYEVLGRDLIAAVNNATNNNRF